MSTSLIQIRNLTKSFRKGPNLITPLEELSLEVARGEFLALMGPSGSGKTTLLNLIAGIDTPSSGELIIDAQDLGTLSRAELTRWRSLHVGYIFQLYHLVPILSAYENVELPLLLQSLSRAQRRTRVETALELVGLSDRSHHRPAELSGGEQQRIAIARALMNDPDIILADEPTGNLDPDTSADIIRILAELRDNSGKTIVMVTHDMSLTVRADQVFVLEGGQLHLPADAIQA